MLKSLKAIKSAEKETTTKIEQSKTQAEKIIENARIESKRLTEEKMALLGFTDKQKQRVKEYPEKLTHFCPKCMKAYQRQEKPLSEDLENCEYCGSELVLTSYEGEVTNILWCPECKKAYQITDERTLAKIGKLAEKSSRQALSKDFTENAE